MWFTIARVCTLAAVLVMASAHDGNGLHGGGGRRNVLRRSRGDYGPTHRAGSNSDVRWFPAENPEDIPLPEPIAAPSATIPAPTGDGEVFYFDSGGDGDAVLLLHANSGSAYTWGYQFPAFTEAGYRVIALSQRGAQGTTAPATNTTQLIEDTIALLDILGIERTHVVGSAGGALMGVRMALAYPERFRTFTCAGSPIGISDPSFWDRFLAIYEPVFGALPSRIKELSPSYRSSNPAGFALWEEIYLESPSGKSSLSPWEFLTYEDLNSISMPVHLVYGSVENIVPPPLARLIHEQFTNSKLTFIQEAGHIPHWEQPAVFNEVVLEYLEFYYWAQSCE